MSHSKGVPARASHLTLEEREVIAHMHRAGKPQTRIAERLGRSKSTVSRALRKTLTLDNGKEFAEHQQLEVEVALRIYFAKPYRAWQRGTNENTNGLIRQFFPKGT